MIEYGSPCWQGGYQQEAPEWCFAAIEQTICASLGKQTKPQEQRAYEIITTLIEFQDFDNPDVSVDIKQFAEDLATLAEANNLNPLPSYSDISGLLTSDLKSQLRYVTGLPDFSSVTAAAGGQLTFDEVIGTINVGGLVAFGDQRHWRIIFGYSDDRPNSANVWVFDPLSGDTSTMDFASAAGLMNLTYRCT